MSESPLLFLSVVPACGSFLLCSQDVEESRSPWRPRADKIAWPAVRKAVHDSSIPAGDGKKPLGRLATLATLAPPEWAVDAFVFSVQKSREQTQNVYENKGTEQKPATSNPSLSKEGNRVPPSPAEERGGLRDLGVLCALA